MLEEFLFDGNDEMSYGDELKSDIYFIQFGKFCTGF